MPGGRPARPPAALQTPTDTSEQNNTGPLDSPVTVRVKIIIAKSTLPSSTLKSYFLLLPHANQIQRANLP